MSFRSAPVRLAALPLACAIAFPALAQSTLPIVVVSATRSELPVTDVVADVTLVDRNAIDRLGAASVSDVLERLPGVTVNRNGGPASTTNVYLRGAEGRFTAVFIDGVRIDSQSTGGATWNAIPLSQVERIEVLRGPAAAVYGSDAMAGVVQIFTRQGEKGFFPSLRLGVGSNSTYEAGAALRGGDGVVDYAFGLGTERSDGFNAKPSGNPDRDGYRNESFSGRFGWKLSEGQKLEATLLDSRQKAGYDGYMPGQDDQSKHHLQTVGLNWNSRWSEAWSTRVGVSRGADRYETTPSVYLTDTSVDSWLLRNELRVGPGRLTVDLERREDRLENASTTPEKTDRHQDALALGYGLRAGDHTLQLNARRDDDSEFGAHTTGSLAYGYALSRTLQLTGSVGTAFRAPTLFQRFSIYGTPDLKAETARNMEAGVRWQEAANRASVVVYRNRVKDLIDYLAGPGSCVNGVGDFAGCYGNTGRATYTGVTLAGGTTLGEVALGASLDLMRPKNAETGQLLARRAKTQATLTADTPVGAWRLGAEVQHLGKRYDDEANTKPLPAHTLLHLTASTDIARDWRLLARVDNATDKDYESVLGYATAGRGFYLGLSWSPR
ncbi:TonB-dependent receptor domain-containing protein [Hydrogenophaga pseudoflava]|uniref:TonB-dependent receptor domain-containing protein n=1 Tax=Hydrogenophaga pseudoflava TaxID=47421 RepID=UPI0027E56F19|nr:TonB-dependent receptor [Hydrogenophaga pseudoflava]MDQ7744110.1 TonB-dependent receptor [Hydrogenophaga pseudoflava]